MADLVIECLARKIVEHLYARFQVAEKNEKIAELKTENKKLQNVIEMHKALFHRLEAENKAMKERAQEIINNETGECTGMMIMAAEYILKGGA